MAASQGHGFTLETLIVSALYPGAPTLGYTAEFDAPAGHSQWSPAHPAQVKSTASRSRADGEWWVMMGDAMRNFDKSAPFEMVVALCRQDGARKTILGYERFAFDPAGYRAGLFGSATREELAAAAAAVKSVPVGAGREPRQAAHRACGALEERSGMRGDLQAKMGSSDGQRRLQLSCPLSALRDAASRSELIGPERFAELGLPAAIDSPPRARRRKSAATTDAAVE